MTQAARSHLVTLESMATHVGHLDHEGALALVERARSDGASLESLITGILAPTLVEVGRQWASGEIGAAEALAAAAIVRAAIPRSSLPPTKPSHRSVAVCCPPGEHHEIPAEMVTELLRAEGWGAQYLGAGVTPKHFPGYLAKQRPAVLLVSTTTPCGLPGAARIIEVAHAHGVPVIVGGAAFGRDDLLALRLGAAAWAPTAREGIEVLEAWSRRAPSLSQAPPLPEEYLLFEAELPEIRAAAVAALRRMANEDESAGLVATQERLDLLLRHLGAALLADESRLFLDFLSWRAVYYEDRQLPSERLANTVTAVATALPPEFKRARRFVHEGGGHLAWKYRPGSDGQSGWTPPSRPAPLTRMPAPAERQTGADIQGPEAARTPAVRDQAGRVFADLLFVAATSCHAPFAMISVSQADGRWSTLSHGVERRDLLADNRLLALVAGRTEPLEIADLHLHPDLGSGALARGPLGVRFVYGVPLRTRQGVLLGVLAILDRRPRELSARERQALTAIARQVAGQLVLWRRGTQNEPAPAEPEPVRLSPKVQELRPGLHAQREGDELLRSHEVAVLFDVTDRTVINWAAAKKLPSIRTAGGHLRFRGDDVLALLAGRPAGDESA